MLKKNHVKGFRDDGCHSKPKPANSSLPITVLGHAQTFREEGGSLVWLCWARVSMDPPAAQFAVCCVSAVTYHVNDLWVNGFCDHIPVVGDIFYHLT